MGVYVLGEYSSGNEVCRRCFVRCSLHVLAAEEGTSIDPR